MARNLDRRVELLIPVEDEFCRRRLLEVLDYYFQDNLKAKRLQSDGRYLAVTRAAGEPEFHCQKELFKLAVQQRAEQFLAERAMFHPHRREAEFDDVP